MLCLAKSGSLEFYTILKKLNFALDLGVVIAIQ